MTLLYAALTFAAGTLFGLLVMALLVAGRREDNEWDRVGYGGDSDDD